MKIIEAIPDQEYFTAAQIAALVYPESTRVDKKGRMYNRATPVVARLLRSIEGVSESCPLVFWAEKSIIFSNYSSNKKTCTRCGISKPLSMYHKDSSKRSGYHPQCRSCKRETSKMYRSKNKENLKKKKASYYLENKEEIAIKRQFYRSKNREAISERNKIYRNNNAKKVKERIKRWRDENPDYSRDYAKKYCERLGNGYVKRLIAHSKSWFLERTDIPQEIIDMKREELILTRTIKSLKDEQR